MRRHAGLLLGLAALLVTAGLALAAPALLHDLELRLLDLRFRLRGAEPAHPRVAVLAVDARSIEAVGRWPWSRETLARLLDGTCGSAPAAVALDIVFSEPQPDPAHRLARELLESPGLQGEARSRARARAAEPTPDEALARSVESCADALVLGYFFRQRREAGAEAETLPGFAAEAAVSQARESPQADLALPEAAAVESNLDLLVEAADHHGFFNVAPDPDGQVRHAQLLWRYQGALFPALSLEAARVALGGPPLSFRALPAEPPRLLLGERPVPLDRWGRQLLDFRGPGGTFETVSAVDVLRGGPTDRLKDRVVFVGVTEVGIKDVRPTPFDPLFPGTEVHATLAGSLLSQRYLTRTEWEPLLQLLALLLLGPALGWFLLRLPRAWAGLAAALAAATLWWTAGQVAFSSLHLWMAAVPGLLTVAGTWSLVTLWRALVVERRAREIRDVFQKYVAPSVVAEMLDDPGRVRLGGERRELSILFSDIRGFTRLSESMDPEELVGFLNAYFTPMTRVILDHQGTFDKYMGDALMAFWGAPLEEPRHAVKACRAAVAMIRTLEEFKRERPESAARLLDIGVGIHSGPVSVGNMGSEQIYDYTVIGDTANLASRLEGANKAYGTRILVSGDTAALLEGEGFLLRPLDRIRVKGRAEPVEVLELLDEEAVASGATRVLAGRFAAGVRAWRAARFEEARTAFSAAAEQAPEDVPSKIYLDRLAALDPTTVTDGWDPVTTLESK